MIATSGEKGMATYRVSHINLHPTADEVQSISYSSYTFLRSDKNFYKVTYLGLVPRTFKSKMAWVWLAN